MTAGRGLIAAIQASAALRYALDRMDMEDETQVAPMELLARYRLLCEHHGAARATDTPLPRDLREQLVRVEAELQTRLWLNSTGGAGRKVEKAPPALNATPAPRAAGSPSSTGEQPQLGSAPAIAMVYTDGACQGNPGPGGYGVLVRVPGQSEREFSGGKARTTNNEMEMTAALVGLKEAIALGAKEITVVSDSEYLVKGMTGWVKGWLRNGWKTAKGEPVKNRALWEELHSLSQGRKVTWSWTRGHHGHAENERVDTLAVAAAQAARQGSR